MSILVGICTLPVVFIAAFDILSGGTLLERAIGVEPGNRGYCAVGMLVDVGEFCVFAPTQGRFRVLENGANPPGEARLATARVKIDWDPSSHTFQATRLPDGDGVWQIEVAGLWRNVGSLDSHCRKDDTPAPGEFCIEPNTGSQFRVYATDELNTDDEAIRAMCPTGEGDKCRPLYANGYGVLFQFGSANEPILDRIPNRHNGRLGGREIRCIDPTSGATVFEVKRQAEEGTEASGDAWRIVTATQWDQEDQVVLDCTSDQERTGS